MTHATRRPARICPCNPPPAHLLISLLPSILNLSLGLKRIAKTDPMPRPTMKNVIAESISYSCVIRHTFLRAPDKKLRNSESPIWLQEPCQFIETLCFAVDA